MIDEVKPVPIYSLPQVPIPRRPALAKFDVTGQWRVAAHDPDRDCWCFQWAYPCALPVPTAPTSLVHQWIYLDDVLASALPAPMPAARVEVTVGDPMGMHG